MPPSTGKTTVPAADSTAAADSAAPWVGLVIAWSAAQPHRVGQIGFCPYGERLFLGRGDDEPEKFVQFVTHRPNETPAVDPREEILAGDSISRRQLEVRSTGNQLEVSRIGRCPTYINDVELQSAGVLRPGDTLRLKGELLLLCVLRPRTLALPEGLRELHAFGEPDPDGIVGESPAAWTLRAQLARAAATRDHVLLRGESGTGKELAARVILKRSTRATGPYIARNAKTIPEALVSPELFGTPRNYPNAGMPARPGLVGAADGGTLFLDEIGELTPAAQSDLLRALDEGEYTVVGEAHARRADIRLVGATNRGDDVFREDFRARLKAYVQLPPLRERREDIPLLVRHLLLARAREYPEQKARLLIETPGGRLEPRVSLRLIEYLLHHPLPTNVREIDRLLLAAINEGAGKGDGEGESDRLTVPRDALRALAQPPPVLPEPKVPPPARPAEARPEAPSKEVLEALMTEHRGNVAKVAEALGCGRATVYRWLESYGIKREPRK